MKTIAAAAVLVLGLAALAGCNTIEGFGKDVAAAGRAVSGAAADNKPSEQKK
jgi:predicted small secreted protein